MSKCILKIWGVHPENWGAKNCLFCDGSPLDETMPGDEKWGRRFYPLSVNARCGYSASWIRWCRIASVNGTIEIKSLVSWGPQNFQFAVASHRAAFSGNTSLIATFASCAYFSLFLWNFLQRSLSWFDKIVTMFPFSLCCVSSLACSCLEVGGYILFFSNSALFAVFDFVKGLPLVCWNFSAKLVFKFFCVLLLAVAARHPLFSVILSRSIYACLSADFCHCKVPGSCLTYVSKNSVRPI